MVTVVKNKKLLKDRLLRYISPESNDRKELFNFIEHVSEYGDVIIFGGVIRDIALYGIKKFKSDVDLVFDGKSSLLDEILLEFDVKKNKFGGYRLKSGGIDVDIWPVKNTWAFKENIVEYVSPKSLLNTTITNWDAIFFSWREQSFSFNEGYFKDILSGYLDVILDKNPNMLGMIVRVLRHFILKEANVFSPRLVKILISYLDIYSLDEMVEYESKSYGEVYITASIVNYVKKFLLLHSDSNSPLVLDKINKTKSIFD